MPENTYLVTHRVTSLKTSVITFLCVNILEQGLNNDQLWLAQPKYDELIKFHPRTGHKGPEGE